MPLKQIPNRWQWRTGLETLEWETVPARGRVDMHPTGKRLGPFVHIKDWSSGVEPKFLAYVCNDQYYEAVRVVLLEYIRRNLKNTEDPIIQFIISNVGSNREMGLKILENAKTVSDLRHLELFKKLEENDVCSEIIINQLKIQQDNLPTEKRLPRYLIKQDYKDPKQGVKKVSISQRRAKFTSLGKSLAKAKPFQSAYAMIYNRIRRREKIEENRNAFLESIATRVAQTTGMAVQEQGLVFGTYQDGHPKVMTLSTFKDGLSDFEGRLTGGSGTAGNYAVEGFVNAKREFEKKIYKYIDNKGKEKVYYHSDSSIKGLGENLVLFIRQGDYDVMGSKGGNKGLVNNALFGIDFGHAYQKDNPLVPILQDDFSCPNKDFKNMSVFYDNPLSEKMKGIYYLNKQITGMDPPREVLESYGAEFTQRINSIKKNSDINIFDEYIKKALELEEQDPKAYKGFADTIRACKKRAIDADAAILNILNKRLGLTASQLDFIDSLEKLFSPTSNISTDGKVRLNHLSVDRENRVVCQLEVNRNTNMNKITITIKDEIVKKQIIDKLIKFELENSDTDINVTKNIIYNTKEKCLEITCNNDQLKKLMSAFTEDRIAHFKKQPTLSSEKAGFSGLQLKDKAKKSSVLFEYDSFSKLSKQKTAVLPRATEQLNINDHQAANNIPVFYHNAVKELVKTLVSSILNKSEPLFLNNFKETKVFFEENTVTGCNFSGGDIIGAASCFYAKLDNDISMHNELKNSVKIEPPSFTLEVSEEMSQATILKMLEDAENKIPKILITDIKIGNQIKESIEDYKKRIRSSALKL